MKTGFGRPLTVNVILNLCWERIAHLQGMKVVGCLGRYNIVIVKVMETNKRRYYRLKPSEDGEPSASFELDGKEIGLTVVNLSPGGLLCYVGAVEKGVDKDTYIPQIKIQMPRKKPLIFTGRVVRTEERPTSQILDAMKRQQPEYPEGLKQEFLRLCRGEEHSEFTTRNPDFLGWIKGILKGK